jgi:hypothetical protein
MAENRRVAVLRSRVLSQFAKPCAFRFKLEGNDPLREKTKKEVRPSNFCEIATAALHLDLYGLALA